MTISKWLQIDTTHILGYRIFISIMPFNRSDKGNLIKQESVSIIRLKTGFYVEQA